MPVRNDMVLVGLVMSFVTFLLVANIVAIKPVDISGWVFPAGLLAYPFTFLVTDTLSELYGRRVTTRVVWFGFVLSVAMVFLVYVAKIMPPAGFWEGQDAYDSILGAVPRIVLASMVAYLVSQHSDVMVFHALRRLTNGDHLWLRNNASTMLSQAIDTLIFISIAFAGSVSTGTLWNMIATQYVIKIGIAVVDTPLIYALVRFAETRKGVCKERSH